MRKTGRQQRHRIILCRFAYEADYGQYVLTSICQEKQQEQATHPEALLFLNPHLDSALGAYHSKGCWSHRRTQHKDIVPETRASKEQQGQTLYFYSLGLGHTVRQTGPHVMVFLTVADSGCVRCRGENSKDTSSVQSGPSTPQFVMHFIRFCPLEGHSTSVFTTSCPLERPSKGHFTMDCPQERHSSGQSPHFPLWKGTIEGI